MNDLDAAQVAIYGILSIPLTYVLFKHGLPGVLGWLYLFAFCSLRIVGGAMALNDSNSKSAAIISSIGLSPLLLAISGVLHEARDYRTVNRNSKNEWVLVIMFHILVTTGLALLASGASAFGGTDPKTQDESLIKGGIITLLLAWVILALWIIISFLPSQFSREAQGFSSGTKLLFAVLFAVPFSGIRMLYSVISILAPTKNINPVNGTLGYRIGLELVQELLVTIALIVARIMTRTVRRKVKGDNEILQLRREAA